MNSIKQNNIITKPNFFKLSISTKKNTKNKSNNKHLLLPNNKSSNNYLKNCSLPELNTIRYRSKFHIKNIINNNCRIDTNKVQVIKRLSEGKTGSSSEVDIIKIKDIPCFYYIIKHQKINKNNSYYFTIEHEKNIYQIVNKLVENYVTPYCITMLNFHQCTDTNNSSLVNNYMLNETIINWQHNKIYTIQEFIKSGKYTTTEFVILLIQIIYTLLCFNKVNLQHNDLHDNNILIFANTKFNPDKPFYRYFKFGSNPEDYFYLPETQYNVRIFDFDRAIKNSVNDKNKLIPELQKEILNDSSNFQKDDFYQYITTKNIYSDIFKIISYTTDNIIKSDNINYQNLEYLLNFCNYPEYSLDILTKYQFTNKKGKIINLIQHPIHKNQESLIKYRFLYYYDQNGNLVNPNKLYRKVFKTPYQYLKYLLKSLADLENKNNSFEKKIKSENILESYSILNIYQK